MSAAAKAETKRARRNTRRAVKPDSAPASDAETQRMENLEHLLDVMRGALLRVAMRADDARSDLGGDERVDGDIARGGLSVVRGIAKEALAEVFMATGRTS